MNRVLVTGATGFTGRYVVPLLKQRGFHVDGLSGADCDIRDAKAVNETIAVRKPNFVVHLAGTPNVPDSEADKAYTVNVDGTLNLLKACDTLPEPPKKIILASSSYVYGDTGSAPAGEEAPLAARGAYGKSKREMESAAACFKRLPIMVVRPFNYTGVGHADRFLVPKLVRLFQKRGADASFVEADVVRDYSDVRWVARIYVELLERAGVGGAINVCSGVGVPLRSLVGVLEELTSHRVTVQARPPNGMPSASLVGSPDRLISRVGTPSPYSLKDTLRWMLAAVASPRYSLENSG